MIEFHAPAALRRWLLGGGCVLVLLALVFWRPLQQQCLLYFLLRADAPSPQVLSEVVDHAGSPSSVLERLWLTQRIPHRQFTLTYLESSSHTKPDLFRAMEPAVLAATQDADIQARELALAVLARMKHSEARRLALEQLADVDPAVRLLGVECLRSIVTSNDVPIAMRLLGDPEPRVVVAAAQILRQVTGQDFGLKSIQALPRFICIGTNPPPAPNWPAINQGVQRWRDWWRDHRADYPVLPATMPPSPGVKALPTPAFSLPDAGGKTVRLSDYRGKIVLLVFWNWTEPVSLEALASLEPIQQRHSDQLVVLGICVPPAPSCADEHEHGPQINHEHHHHGETSGKATGEMPAQVQVVTARLKINYPMLIDAKEVIGPRFKIEDLPAYILIGADGMVRRRFIGVRTEAVFQAIVEEVAGSTLTQPVLEQANRTASATKDF